MSSLSTETFTLLGPKPEVLPSWLELHRVELSLYALLAVLLISGIIYYLRRRRATRIDPAVTFRSQMRMAQQSSPAQASALTAVALRNYLAAIAVDAPTGLTTQELAGALLRSPILSTSADAILRVLRAADRAKFAGELSDHQEVIRLAEEAFARLELARQALWREVAP